MAVERMVLRDVCGSGERGAGTGLDRVARDIERSAYACQREHVPRGSNVFDPREGGMRV